MTILKTSIIALMNYAVFPEEEERGKYEFALVEWTDSLLKNFEQARKEKVAALSIGEIKVYDAQYFYDQVFEVENPEFAEMKMDSISFLDPMPDLSSVDFIKCSAMIILTKDHWVLQAHQETDSYPTIIYRSARLGYEKLELCI